MDAKSQRDAKTVLKELVIMTFISFLPYVAIPAIAQAQVNFDPLPASGGVNLQAGSFTPPNSEAFTLPKGQVCTLVTEEWGWEDCVGIDRMVFVSTPETDNLMIMTPNRDGYVEMDDWTEEDAAEMIRQIEASLKKSAISQSERTGDDIEFRGWRVRPTLDRQNHFLYYATDWSFNGDITTNIKATVFDRRGYIVMAMVPLDSALNSAGVNNLIRANLQGYSPSLGESYSSFVTGDKVAAVGALGVLGTLVGVKYGKAIAGGALVFLLALAKKFFIVIPLVVLGGIGTLWSRLKRSFTRS